MSTRKKQGKKTQGDAAKQPKQSETSADYRARAQAAFQRWTDSGQWNEDAHKEYVEHTATADRLEAEGK